MIIPQISRQFSKSRPANLAPFLNRLLDRYHHPRFIRNDPLSWPRSYANWADREIAAFLAASLAYGNVAQIDRSLRDLFKRMGRSPANFARNFVPGKSDRALEGFYHRFNDDRDLSALIHLLGQMLRGWGSIENFWRAAQREGERRKAKGETVADRAGRFIDEALKLDLEDYFSDGVPPRNSGRPISFYYLLPMANGPSACKRLNMFLRWVIRPDDGIDLGLWSAESPADLEFPVDTHILRISKHLGATRRKIADARTRKEITDFFRRFSPDDPVKYDFALCRLGILRLWKNQS